MMTDENEVTMIATTDDAFDAERGRPLVTFNRGKDLFEVFDAGTSDLPYIGYFNGERSVSAASIGMVTRGLIRKHVIGLPEGTLIIMAEATARRAIRLADQKLHVSKEEEKH